MLSIAALPPALTSRVLTCKPGWREAFRQKTILLKDKAQRIRAWLEIEPLDPESSALTMSPVRLLIKQHAEW